MQHSIFDTFSTQYPLGKQPRDLIRRGSNLNLMLGKTMDRLHDFSFSVIIVLLVPIFNYYFEPIQHINLGATGNLSFVIIPLTCVIICSIIKPVPFFLTGIGLAFALPLIATLAYTAIFPGHGIIGLDYYLGSIGACFGSLLALIYSKRKKYKATRSIGLLSFAFAIVAFFVTQQYFCNTVLYCGPFSLIFYTK